MNSKGIQPRVGMQVTIEWESSEVERKTVSAFERSFGTDYVLFNNATTGTKDFFMEGNYEIEWIPPTDKERVMFANAANNLRAIESCEPHSCDGFCNWRMEEFGIGRYMVSAVVAESLALDGMDIDDVSKIEELMR